jgi:hypothetical protein
LHPDIRLLLAKERHAELVKEATVSRLVRDARTARRAPAAAPALAVGAHVTLRLDRVGDAGRLGQLAALNERTLGLGPFVVAEVEGRVVAAMPAAGGEAIADPFVPTVHLLRLLELRAAQVRCVQLGPRRRLRLLPRRA